MAELPPEAGNLDEPLFEPNQQWLEHAPKEQQKEAMRRWFLARYEDPANETPWDSEEKSYVFVWGGPYNPNEVIQERFSGVVDFEVMWELIEELWAEGGDEWAPTEHEGADYDDYIESYLVTSRTDPLKFLKDRLAQIDAAIPGQETEDTRLIRQLLHSALIAALEAYLADTASFWITEDKAVLRKFVSTNTDLQERKLTLGQLFERHEKLEQEVLSYLADFVWHRLGKVKPMLASALEIEVPDIGELMRDVKLRHDIVHRAGRTAEGEPVEVSIAQLHELHGRVLVFADAINEALKTRFPPEEDPF